MASKGGSTSGRHADRAGLVVRAQTSGGSFGIGDRGLGEGVKPMRSRRKTDDGAGTPRRMLSEASNSGAVTSRRSLNTPRGKGHGRGERPMRGPGSSPKVPSPSPSRDRADSSPTPGAKGMEAVESDRFGVLSSAEETEKKVRIAERRSSQTSSHSTLSEFRASSAGAKARESGITVCARIRPNLLHESEEPDGVKVMGDRSNIILTNACGERKQFALDEVFDSRSAEVSQTFVYARVGKDLAVQALKGFNVCMFAYGHTGSGKTFTMLGDSTSGSVSPNIQGTGAGLLPRFTQEVFEAIRGARTRQGNNADARYTCEYYEIYNEQIFDLLAPNTSERKRTVHAHPKFGVRIDNLSTSVVSSAEEVLGLVHFGNQMRTVAATTMNERSSRSHAIFTFKVEIDTRMSFGFEVPDERQGTHRESTIMFVDLAGREDQLVSTNRELRFREMCHINTSLFHLTHLIQKIADGKVNRGSLAGFRSSKLTLLLSQSLVGSCRTLAMCTLAAPQCYFDDTLATMQFASKVKKIKTTPIVNNKTSNAVLLDLESEVAELKRQLVAAQASPDKEEELRAAQSLIAHYKQSWSDAVARSDQQKQTRSRMSVALGFSQFGSGIPERNEGGMASFLTKLSDDPSLQGCCNFFLLKAELTIGSGKSADIQLQGVGLLPKMCVVRDDPASEGVIVELVRATSETPSSTGRPIGSLSSFSPSSSSQSESDSDGDSSDGEATDAEVPRVLINGEPLSKKCPRRTLQHGSCLFLGYAHAFRLIVPTKERVDSAGGGGNPAALARRMLPSLDMEIAVSEIMEENRGEYKEVRRQLQARVPECFVQELLQDFHAACPLIAEANMITKEVFADNPSSGRVRFALQMLTDSFAAADHARPKLVICVLQEELPVDGTMRMSSKSTVNTVNSSQAQPGRCSVTYSSSLTRPRTSSVMMESLDPVRYVWTMEKFVRRLSEMREIYQQGCDAFEGWPRVRRRLQEQPYLNPWQELAFADVKLLATSAREDVGGGSNSIWQRHGSVSASNASMDSPSLSPQASFAATLISPRQAMMGVSGGGLTSSGTLFASSHETPAIRVRFEDLNTRKLVTIATQEAFSEQLLVQFRRFGLGDAAIRQLRVRLVEDQGRRCVRFLAAASFHAHTSRVVVMTNALQVFLHRGS
eukprot:TRINITY_DN28128_c1_g2_i3.p1 TRINITY_DN28128_c1_g2~~TRINITY_DN28128_c1_g2_i3.p1  ORF type:complete len:1158 (-),score=237.26 TRINITY_DN28128_c1_g2_i3:854-4327(-)